MTAAPDGVTTTRTRPAPHQEPAPQVEGDRPATWALRAWCAKEAVGKALGYGLAAGPHSVTVDRIDAGSGYVYLTLAGPLADLFPNLTGEQVAAYTALENGHVLASVLNSLQNAQ